MIDEFFCKKCRKSSVGEDSFCVNCGHCARLDEEVGSFDYEEDSELVDDEFSDDSEDLETETEDDYYEEVNSDDSDRLF